MPKTDSLARRSQHFIPVFPSKLALYILTNVHDAHCIIGHKEISIDEIESQFNVPHIYGHSHLVGHMIGEELIVDRRESVPLHCCLPSEHFLVPISNVHFYIGIYI